MSTARKSASIDCTDSACATRTSSHNTRRNTALSRSLVSSRTEETSMSIISSDRFMVGLSWKAEIAGWAITKFQCNCYAKQVVILKRQENSLIDHIYKTSDDLAQQTPLPRDDIDVCGIEKLATMSKIPGKVFMVDFGIW